MRARPGTSVKVTVKRAGTDAPVDFMLERSKRQVHSAKSGLLEPGYGYVRITTSARRWGSQQGHRNLTKKLRPAGKLNEAVVLDRTAIRAGTRGGGRRFRCVHR